MTNQQRDGRPVLGLHARICRVCDTPFVTDDGRCTRCSPKCRADGRRVLDRTNQAKHRDTHRLRDVCRQTLKNAIVLGYVRRPDRCEACGELAFAEGHHEDYSKPFFVEWLCRPCHAKLDDGGHFGDSLEKPDRDSVLA